MIQEDSFSHYHDHFLKTYLGDGIVNEQKVMIIDVDPFRDRQYWLKFLPAVFKIKADDKQETETQKSLTVAWRYNNLLASDSTSTQSQVFYKFDSSREMQTHLTNSSSHPIHRDEMTVVLKYDHSNLIDLWEQICEQV